MSLQSVQRGGKVFIPPCKNAECESWILKIEDAIKLDLECVTKLRISGSFLTHFEKQFEECDFTILHFCPYLWKRISKVEEILRAKENKLILVRFEDERLIESYGKVAKEENHRLEAFFEDFDSDQIITDDAEVLQTFKDNVLSCLEDIHQTDDVCVETRSELTHIKEYDEMDHEDEEEAEEDILKFENYPEFISNSKYLFVRHTMVQCDGRKEIDFSKTEFGPLKKTMQQINELGNRHTKEEVTSTLTYILFQVIPDLYEKKDVIRLASFSMCRHLSIHRRAMDSLELLLWEKVDQVQNFTTLNSVQQILMAALADLKYDFEASQEKSYLLMLQRLANVYLIVLGLIFIQCHETPEISTSCFSYFDTIRNESPFASSRSVDQKTMFDLGKQFDADLCLGIIDSVIKGARECKQKSAEQILQDVKPEILFGKMSKKSMAVHLMVVTQLLKKVYSLDEDALSIMEKYMDGPTEKSPFIYTILYSLTLFLVYETQKSAHADIKDICTKSVLVIRKSIPDGCAKQVDIFLQRLLFNANPSIRHEMIKLFKDTDRYGLLPAFLQNEMEHRLSPLLTKWEGESGGQFGWKKVSGQFNNLDVWIFFYFMNQRDHKSNKTTFSEKDLFYTEMKQLAHLQHKNIIKMFAYQYECIPQFYITENCEQHLQGHLENKWRNNACYTPSQLLQFLVDAVVALEYCHKKGYVHCNMTAESLIVFDHTYVKLAGFGLCKKIDPVTAKANDINSKHIAIRWSAPESILEGEYSKASDMWMVGHLLYEVMTHGLLPYSYVENDEELIELMKHQQVKLTIEPVVERKAILQLLSDCTDYNEEHRTYAANVKTTLKTILTRVNKAPGKKAVFSKDFDAKKCSTNCKKGVPDKFHKSGKKLIKNAKEKVNYSSSMDRSKEDGEFIFSEKITHEFSASMETSFSSPILDHILPQKRQIVQNPSEMKKIQCRIPCENCFCLLDMAFKKEVVKEVGDLIFFMQKVAAKLAELSKHIYVIGDICAANVYVEVTNKPEVHIVSLAYLKTINCEEELSQTSEDRIVTSISESVKRRASPEVIQYGRFSEASDVFCFGNFMWEVLTAFSVTKKASLFFNNDVKIFRGLSGNKPNEICDAILSGKWEKHHPQPNCCPSSLYELIKLCVSTENERPSMNHVSVKLLEYCNLGADNVNASTDGNGQNRNSEVLSAVNSSIHSGSTASLFSTSSLLRLRIANPSTCSSTSTSNI